MRGSSRSEPLVAGWEISSSRVFSAVREGLPLHQSLECQRVAESEQMQPEERPSKRRSLERWRPKAGPSPEKSRLKLQAARGRAWTSSERAEPA
jgi:hypothetical protein